MQLLAWAKIENFPLDFFQSFYLNDTTEKGVGNAENDITNA